ncbi:peptidase family M1 [Trichuris trichiura]|uniref:Peptidase family M1 n=1 Tax=Trichuris trichiura TaxID=36087 RepID=A0A077ZEW4_TRITR|nr:peptidase family M1 [Trichuris trichiura]
MLSDLPSIDVLEGRPDELPSRLPLRASPVGVSSLATQPSVAEQRLKLDTEDTYTISKKWAFILFTLIALLLLLSFVIPVIVYYSTQCSYFSTEGYLTGFTDSSYRFPRTVLPVLYYVDLKVFLPLAGAIFDPRLSFRFSGKVAIVLTCTIQTRHIILNSVGLKISLEQAELQETETRRAIQLTNVTYETSAQRLILEAEQPMEIGRNYTLTLAYTGAAARHPCSGVYRISYSESGQEKYFLAVQVGPAAARWWFPSMDEPDLSDGWKKTTFSHTKQLAPHLLAFVVGHLAYKEIPKSRSGKLRLWLRPSFIEASYQSLTTISAVLNALENYIGYDVVDAKLDVVGLPMYVATPRSQATNLIVLSEMDIIYGEKSVSGISLEKGTLNVGNALAQQWFGNLVTPKWWNSYWIGPSAACFLQLIIANLIVPQEESLVLLQSLLDERSFRSLFQEGEFITEIMQAALEWDALPSSVPLSGNVKVPSEALRNFSPQQYKKGAAILRMIYHVIGDTIFKQVLSSLVKKYAYASIDHVDWLNVLAEATDRLFTRPNQLSNVMGNATTIFRGWFDQPTYPLLTLVRQYEAGLAMFKQAPVTLLQQTDFAYRQWNVPIWYQQEPSSPVLKIWLKAGDEARTNVPKAPYNFVLAAAGAIGYYRVQYDEANWQLTNMQLQVQHELIDVKSRAQLLDDAFSLARSGKLNYHLALDMTKYLPQEMDITAWRVAARHIEYLDLMLSSTRYESDINRFALNAYEAVYHRLGFEPTDSAATKQGAYRIPMNLRPTVYCVSVAEAESSQQWSFLWKKFTEEDNINEQEALLRGLSCTKDIMLLNNLLDKALSDKEVKLTFTPLLYQCISNHPTGRAMLWDFTTRNWDRIIENFRDTVELDYMVRYATKAFKTVRTLETVQAFVTGGKNLASSKQVFIEQLQTIHENIFWTEHYLADVVRWIQNNVPGMHSIYKNKAE